MKIGIDVGSTGIKIVFVKEFIPVWKKVVPTKPGQSSLVNKLIGQGLNALNIEQKDIKKNMRHRVRQKFDRGFKQGGR